MSVINGIPPRLKVGMKIKYRNGEERVVTKNKRSELVFIKFNELTPHYAEVALNLYDTILLRKQRTAHKFDIMQIFRLDKNKEFYILTWSRIEPHKRRCPSCGGVEFIERYIQITSGKVLGIANNEIITPNRTNFSSARSIDCTHCLERFSTEDFVNNNLKAMGT